MKKMIQRVGASICCCLVCLQFMIQPASAFIPVVVGADLLYSVLASAAVTCGVTFSVIETFNPVVDAIKNKMVDNGISEEAIKGYIAEGTRLVFDVATGAWKTAVTLPDPLWNGVNTAIKALYLAGAVDITQGSTTVVNAGDYLYNASTGYSILPVTFSEYSGQEVWRLYKNGDYIHWARIYYYGETSSNFLVDKSYPLSSTFTAQIAWNGTNYRLGTSRFNDTLDDPNVVITYGSISTIGQIQVSSAVENPDYDWENEITRTKVIEFPSTYNGDPNDDSDENKKLVYWPDIERYLQGKNAGDLASVNPTGIENPSTLPVPNPADSVTDYTDPPAGGSESNTSLKGLLFTKFPFCIPWDIKNAFKLLVASPVPPAWDIDLVPAAIKQQCGISADTTWHINMDGMEVVGTVARFCSTIGFCLALAIATRKIIGS